jgi:hypothetical protein
VNPEIVSKLSYYMSLAATGTARDIDMIMRDLNEEITLVDSKFIDYALSLVKAPEGVAKIADYLFNGTQMQRNYCTLFFDRRCERGDWELVKKAYKMGLIDYRQAYSK